MSLASDDTVHLLQRWHAEGDRDALGRLLEKHLPQVHAFVSKKLNLELRALRRDQDSMDLVQTAAAKVLGYLPRFVPENGACFERLLRMFVINDIRNQLKSPRFTRRIEVEDDYGHSVLELRSSSRSSHRPDRIAKKAEKRELVRAWARFAMEFLGDDERRLCYMRTVEGVSWIEIAREFDKTPDAVRMDHVRILAKLANITRRLREHAVEALLDESGA